MAYNKSFPSQAIFHPPISPLPFIPQFSPPPAMHSDRSARFEDAMPHGSPRKRAFLPSPPPFLFFFPFSFQHERPSLQESCENSLSPQLVEFFPPPFSPPPPFPPFFSFPLPTFTEKPQGQEFPPSSPAFFPHVPPYPPPPPPHKTHPPQKPTPPPLFFPLPPLLMGSIPKESRVDSVLCHLLFFLFSLPFLLTVIGRRE